MSTRFLSLDQLSHMAKPEWLIEGLFERNSLVMLAGPSYSFKSFLVLSWMLSMASGRSWEGRKTIPSKVAYLLGEGKSSVLKRIRAWIIYNKLTREERNLLEENFRVSFDVVQLADSENVDTLLQDLKEEGFTPDLIAIDTFARSLVGLDENDAKDTGMWCAQADRLRQLGYGVIFLHHTKKNTEFGVQYRGSTAIMGAMDTALTLVRDHGYCTLTVTKQKDHDEGQPIRFRRELVNLSDGDSSCVLVEAPVHKETEDQRVMLDFETQRVSEDPQFNTDASRARELARATGLSEAAAKMRLSRKKVVT